MRDLFLNMQIRTDGRWCEKLLCGLFVYIFGLFLFMSVQCSWKRMVIFSVKICCRNVNHAVSEFLEML